MPFEKSSSKAATERNFDEFVMERPIERHAVNSVEIKLANR